MAPFADDAVSYDLPPPLEYRSADARNASALEEWFATWEGSVSVELSEPTVLVDGDLAVVFGLSRLRGTKKDGDAIDSWSRRTVALQRRGGTWRIVHDHNSFPMLMDGSDKAALNLKPV